MILPQKSRRSWRIAGGDPQPALVEPVHAPVARPAASNGTIGRLRPDDPRQPRKIWGRLPLFQSLLVPVMLTFLVIPPEQGKDLDNIALTALPIAHEVLRPHIAPHLLYPTYGDDERASQRDALDRLKSVNARSVRAYQVIELPRSPQDPPEGTLHLALGLHSHHWSWWHRASTYLHKAVDQADQGYQFDYSMWRSIFTG